MTISNRASVGMAEEAASGANAFLLANPAILTEETARLGAKWVQRLRAAMADLEDERKREVGPLNEQVKAINEDYAGPTLVTKALLEQLRKTLTDWANEEEERRERKAAADRAEASRLAMEALASTNSLEEAATNAAEGEVVDFKAAIHEAQEKLTAAKRADRTAARSERESTVRLGTGIGKVIAPRTVEYLTVSDPVAALHAMGCTPAIMEAMIKQAREFRRENGTLPDGVTAHTQREI